MSEAPPLWLCVHETGHAVAHFVLNEPLPQIETVVVSLSVDPENCKGSKGLVRTKNRSRNVPREVIRHLAGYVAENYFRDGRDWRPCVDTFGADVRDVGDDFARACDCVATLDVADPAAELHRLWNVTYRLVDAEWPSIMAVASELQSRLTIPGAEAEAIWRRNRKPADRRAYL